MKAGMPGGRRHFRGRRAPCARRLHFYNSRMDLTALTALSPLDGRYAPKLDALRPLNVGQAGRVSGVSPADVAALLIWLQTHDKEADA